jgi:hypothetical protein
MIPLGFELGSGRAIAIPPAHTVFVGQTQRAGKTTTLEACAVRSGYSCLAFLTKRGEASFRLAREIPPYYSDDFFDWEIVRDVCLALTGARWGEFQRQAVRVICEEGEIGTPGKPSFVSWPRPENFAELEENIAIALPKASGRMKMSLIEVRADVRKARRELDRLQVRAADPELELGLNVVNLEAERPHIQSLVISSMMNHLRQRESRSIVCLPEAWKFTDSRRRTPVGEAARQFIREGAALHNFLWIDSQTLAGLSGELLAQIRVWLFGVQRYKAEIEKTLDAIPDNIFPRPSRGDIANLKLGQFVLAFDGELLPVYVQPVWMSASHAQAIACGEELIESARDILEEFDGAADNVQ